MGVAIRSFGGRMHAELAADELPRSQAASGGQATFIGVSSRRTADEIRQQARATASFKQPGGLYEVTEGTWPLGFPGRRLGRPG